MTHRPLAWLLAALVGGALLAGCGSSGSSSSSQSNSTPAATSSTPAGSAGTSTSGTGTTASSGGAVAVAACKQAIQEESSLPASAKHKLEGVCNKAASGNAAEVRKAAEEVCAEVVKSSSVPSGPAKEEALAACKSGK